MSHDQLFAYLKTKFDPTELEQIEAAYQFAKTAHEGQLRDSGEEYIIHPTQVAYTLAEWDLDKTAVIAGLLHDVLEDTTITKDEMVHHFGEEVTFIVDGVSKLGRHVRYAGNEQQIETLKKMILAFSKDVRVVFVKLADRLHNMHTLDASPIIKQKRRALETTDIYAPLAYRLGMANVSAELEELSFPYIYPEEYRWLRKAAGEHIHRSEIYLQKVKTRTIELLDRHHVPYLHIDARAKRLSSLYKKLHRLDMDITRVYDLVALRIIVPTVADCYAALGIIHQQWPPMPGKIKDYIALPKPNGYRSLHTTVYCIDNKPTEFQIRTEEMHQENEYGLAAYWAYQQSKATKNYERGSRVSFAQKSEFDFLNQFKNWQSTFSDSKQALEALKIDLFKDRVFVLTPTGEVIDLPEGSTPVDFAYAIHSDIGDHCIGARVNSKLVALDYQLQSGDAVEILTQKKKKPSESWLDFVKTSRAREKVRSAVRISQPIIRPKRLTITIVVEDRMGLIKDITEQFATHKINISNLHTRELRGSKYSEIKIVVNGLEATERANRLILRLKKLREVKEISQVYSA